VKKLKKKIFNFVSKKKKDFFAQKKKKNRHYIFSPKILHKKIFFFSHNGNYWSLNCLFSWNFQIIFSQKKNKYQSLSRKKFRKEKKKIIFLSEKKEKTSTLPFRYHI
jgi:hypothetical protein